MTGIKRVQKRTVQIPNQAFDVGLPDLDAGFLEVGFAPLDGGANFFAVFGLAALAFAFVADAPVGFLAVVVFFLVLAAAVVGFFVLVTFLVAAAFLGADVFVAVDVSFLAVDGLAVDGFAVVVPAGLPLFLVSVVFFVVAVLVVADFVGATFAGAVLAVVDFARGFLAVAVDLPNGFFPVVAGTFPVGLFSFAASDLVVGADLGASLTLPWTPLGRAKVPFCSPLTMALLILCTTADVISMLYFSSMYFLMVGLDTPVRASSLLSTMHSEIIWMKGGWVGAVATAAFLLPVVAAPFLVDDLPAVAIGSEV